MNHRIAAAAALLAACSLVFAESGSVSSGAEAPAAAASSGAEAPAATGAVADPSPLFSGSSESGAAQAAIPAAEPAAEAPVACTMEYAPVCGADGKTYPNACNAKAAGQAATPGECAKPSAPAAVVPVPALAHYLNLGDNNKETQALQAWFKYAGRYDGAVGVPYDERLGAAINAYLLERTKAKWTGSEVAEPKKYLALQKALKAEAVTQRWNLYKAKRDALYLQIDALNRRRAADFQANKAAFKAIDDERKAVVAEYARKMAENKAKFQAALKAQAAAKAASQKAFDAIIAKVKAADAAYKAGK